MTCDSWIYRNFWCPVADRLVAILPRSLAANNVTILGFLWTLIPSIWVFYEYNSTFTNPKGMSSLPLWMFAFQSFAYYMARLLDEMDGKQARRLKNGSICGMLVDHGCDGYSMGFFVMVLGKLF